jgi:hypothetical protein
MTTALTPDDLTLIYQAALKAKIDPSSLKTKNPFETDASPTAVTLRAAITLLDPAAAERLSDAAGTQTSLATSAYLAGVGALTPEVRKELAIVKPAKLAEIKSAEMAAEFKRFEEAQVERREQQAAVNEQISAQAQDARIQSLNLIRLGGQAQ